ncbi:MAG TPA: membrane protein insertion efficiency factor YidD [Pseudobdellovibrionaceae bacterium]
MRNLRKQWTRVLRPFENLPKAFLLLLVGAYRTFGTTHMGGACRFTPSCSEYAVKAIKSHSLFPAIYLITKRILKCRPGGTYGIDPVPACSCSGVSDARTK